MSTAAIKVKDEIRTYQQSNRGMENGKQMEVEFQKQKECQSTHSLRKRRIKNVIMHIGNYICQLFHYCNKILEAANLSRRKLYLARFWSSRSKWHGKDFGKSPMADGRKWADRRSYAKRGTEKEILVSNSGFYNHLPHKNRFPKAHCTLEPRTFHQLLPPLGSTTSIITPGANHARYSN